ncbi:MAG: response regulator transcription factor [Myxococcota bacterium]
MVDALHEEVEPKGVCLVAYHPLVIQELRHALQNTVHRFCTYELPVGLPTEQQLQQLPACALYVVDLDTSLGDAEPLCRALIARRPDSRVVVTSRAFDELLALSLMRLGVRGFILYADVADQLPRAVPAVLQGGLWASRDLLTRFVDAVLPALRQGEVGMVQGTPLSRREREICDALLHNLSNKEIAQRLHISERTVKFHVSNLLQKFHVRRRADLVVLYSQGRALHS